MLARTVLAVMTWSRDRGDAGRFAAHRVRDGGRVQPRPAQSEVVMSKILPALKGIEAARKWERGAAQGEGEVMVSAAALVKAALLVLVVLAVVSTLLLLLLPFEPPVTGSTGGARGVAL